MSVPPPRLQGMGWCRWHSPGGQSQPSAVQPPCSRVLAIRCGPVWKRRVRPRSRTWDFPPRTAGMIPASHASRRAWPALIDSPVSRFAACEAAEEGVEGHGDDDGGVDPAGLREVLGGVAVDQLGERPAQAFRGRASARRAARGRGLVFGGGEGQEGLLERGAGEGVEGEPAVDLAVSVLPHREPGGGGRVAFLALQELASWASAASGSTTSRSRRPNRFNARASKCSASASRWASASWTSDGVEVGGEVVEGPEDGLGLLDVDPTLGEGVAGLVVGLQPGGQPDGAVRRRRGWSWCGGPARSRSRSHRTGRGCRAPRPGRPAGSRAR